MKEKPDFDCDKYRQIAQMAKMGWWPSGQKMGRTYGYILKSASNNRMKRGTKI